jgi:ATP-dependent Lhr-like helicase
VLRETEKKTIHNSKGYAIIYRWMKEKGIEPFLFQEKTWASIMDGKSGLVNAPTGCGKTFSVFLGALIAFINDHPDYQTRKNNGLQMLWITPLRALAKDIGRAMEDVIRELNMNWRVGIRNGDTPVSERQKQKRQMPEVLIITPESLHLLLAQKNYPELFLTLKVIAVDEWHELLGSKRGVQVELAISRIVNINLPTILGEQIRQSVNPTIRQSVIRNPQSAILLWGISATIGNLDQALDVLISPIKKRDQGTIIKADIRKDIEVESIFPEEIE